MALGQHSEWTTNWFYKDYAKLYGRGTRSPLTNQPPFLDTLLATTSIPKQSIYIHQGYTLGPNELFRGPIIRLGLAHLQGSYNQTTSTSSGVLDS